MLHDERRRNAPTSLTLRELVTAEGGMNAHATNAEFYTFPWGNPREAFHRPGLKHPADEGMIATNYSAVAGCGVCAGLK